MMGANNFLLDTYIQKGEYKLPKMVNLENGGCISSPNRPPLKYATVLYPKINILQALARVVMSKMLTKINITTKFVRRFLYLIVADLHQTFEKTFWCPPGNQTRDLAQQNLRSKRPATTGVD